MGVSSSRLRYGAINDGDVHDYLSTALTTGSATRGLDNPSEKNNIAPIPIVTVPLSQVTNATDSPEIQDFLAKKINAKSVRDLFYGDTLPDLFLRYYQLMKSEPLKKLSEDQKNEVCQQISDDLQNKSLHLEKQKIIIQIYHLIMRKNNLDNDETKITFNEIKLDRTAFINLLYFFHELPLSNEIKNEITSKLFKIDQIDPLLPTIVNNYLAKILKEKETDARIHTTSKNSQTDRLESVIQDAMQLLGLLSAGIVGSIAAYLFYPPLVKGWQPFFKILGWSEQATTKFLAAITFFATVSNSGWNTSLLNEARKLWTKHGLSCPIFHLIFSGGYKKPHLKENFSNLLYGAYLLTVMYAFALGTNRLITEEDYSDFKNPHAALTFTEVMNIIIFTAAANAAWAFTEKLRNYRKENNILKKLMAKGDDLSLEMLFALRLFRYNTSIWQNSTPTSFEFLFSPFKFQVFNNTPLRLAAQHLRNLDSHIYYAKTSAAKLMRALAVLERVTDTGAAPSNSMWDSGFFKAFLFGLSFFAVAGTGLLGLFAPEEASKPEMIAIAILGSIGLVGTAFNELAFSYNFMTNMRGPTLAKLIGGATNVIVNLVTMICFAICLPSGSGPGKGWFLLLENLFPPEWNYVSALLSTIVWVAYLVGGATNAFPIQLFVNEFAQALIGLYAYSTGDMDLLNKCVDFKRMQAAFEKNENLKTEYLAQVELQLKQPAELTQILIDTGSSTSAKPSKIAPLPYIETMGEILKKESSSKWEKVLDLQMEQKRDALSSDEKFANALKPESFSFQGLS